MEIVSHDEVVNKYIGEKGTPKRDAFDKEVSDYTTNFIIEKLFSKFDFTKVNKAMTALNWTWATCDNQVPTIDHMKEKVAQMIKDLLSDEQALSIRSGGYLVSRDDKQSKELTLEFILCYADSDEAE